MRTFADYLAELADKGELINTSFEQRLFDLVGVMHRIARALEAERIPYQVIGGLAVLVHVEAADPEHSTLPGDVNLMVDRSDLERIVEVATHEGFRYTTGIDTLMRGRHTVRLTFANPESIAPVRKQILGESVMLMPVAELVRAKLSSFRDMDRVHVRSMDAARLVSTAVEQTLPAELIDRLRIVRETE